MSVRLAPDEAVTAWREDGWVLLEGLVGTDEIDAATADLRTLFPSADDYHADPVGEMEKWLGRPPPNRDPWVWPPDGPGFRPEQHLWLGEFPFPGSGALNRLCVHPAIVDFMERALQTTDLRLYQARVNAKYAGLTNYEQPMHTDRNHSLLPPLTEPPWLHVESFLYLSDVDAGTAPTHLVSVRDSVGHSPTEPLIMPEGDPALYAAERPATGVRGSLLAYRPDVFHRGVDLTDPGAARFLLNVSFKSAGQDWVGYDSIQSRANSLEWDAFAQASTPKELALFGFPLPGHPVWDEQLVEATALRYPKLDLTPWRAALR
ncbi:MAG: hypothetical protein ACXVKA_01115 [Acidimicrobiia bacterium]